MPAIHAGEEDNHMNPTMQELMAPDELSSYDDTYASSYDDEAAALVAAFAAYAAKLRDEEEGYPWD
jgi:hypothetical protein